MDFVFCSVKALPLFIDSAKRLGIKHLMVCNTFSKQELQTLKETRTKGITLHFCQLLSSHNAQDVKTFRGLADALGIIGNSIQANFFAVHAKLDYLFQPAIASHPVFDIGMASKAKEHNVTIVFLLQAFLNVQGKQRASLLRNTFLAQRLLKNKKVPVLFFSGARESLAMRAEKGLIAFALLLGYSEPQAAKALAYNTVNV